MASNRPLIRRIEELSSPLSPIPSACKEELTKLTGIRAVLFDIYGTLFISGSGDIGIGAAVDTDDAFNASLNNACFRLNPDRSGPRGVKILREKISNFHDRQKLNGIEYPDIDIREILKSILKAMLRAGDIEGSLTPESVEMMALEYECRVNPTWPMPEAEQTIDDLFKNKLILGIVSNAQFYTPLLFPAQFGRTHQELGFNDRACIWSYRLLEAKPSTLMFTQALEALKADHSIIPGEVLYVGNDKLNDIWPAARVGCKTALFAGDKRSLRLRETDSRCKQTEPDVIITRLSRIMEII